MKKIVTMFSLCFLFLSIGMTSDIAAANNGDQDVIQVCHDGPAMPKYSGGGANKEQIKKDVLDPNGIKQFNSKGQEINYDVLYLHHVVVYGASHDDTKTQNFCGKQVTMHRYLGYDEKGTNVSNPFFRVDITERKNYFITNDFYMDPWSPTSPVYQKWAKGKSTMPKPVKNNLSTEDLLRAWDTFDGTESDMRGNLIKVNNHEKVALIGENLRRYASGGSPPGDFSFGTFDVYSYSPNVCLDDICYSTHVIPPRKDPFKNFEQDAEVQLDIKTKFVNEKPTGIITVLNNWDKDKPLSITVPCDNTKTQGKAQCNTSYRGGGLVVTYLGDGSEVFRQSLSINENGQDVAIQQGAIYELSLDKFDIPFEKSGKYEISVWIPQYIDLDGNKEKTYVNNATKKVIDYMSEKNASVAISGSTHYAMTDPLTNKITVHNNMLSPISGDTTVSLLDESGNHLQTIGSFSYSDLNVREDITFDISDKNIQLEPGTYFIEAKIPHYPNEDRYDDNTAKLVIQVGPFVPENTKCKKITTQFVNVLPFDGEDPGITRACIGWAPNYPSTRVEGGQGTYFYFAYKIFPTPMPAYKVTTSDKLGLYQSFELSEPMSKLGACDLRKDDPLCKMYEPFLYYPARWEGRFGSDPALADFKGPYTVGPHEFYHYRYRGRLLPQQVTFHYDIVDMKGNKSNIPLAFGEVVYDLPDSCFHENTIDIKEECRTIQFYVPTDGRSNPLTLPEDATAEKIPKERIRFYNPGEHTFRVEVDEKQMYLYQSDEGAEWQGKEKVLREPLANETVKGEPMTKEVIVHRYWEGIYNKGEKANPSNGFLGAGGWCGTWNGAGCTGTYDAHRKMTTSMDYSDEDGYKGTLTQDYINNLTGRSFYHQLNDSSMWQTYSPRQMSDVGDSCWVQYGLKNYCDNSGQGYDFRWRTFFTDANGNVTKRSPWLLTQTLFEEITTNFPGWPKNYGPTDAGFTGTEWQRYQIVGGIVKKDAVKDADGDGYDDSGNGSKYPMGPVKTHTLETLASGEIKWVNQDEYKNHCYSEEDAFSKYGEWDKTKPTFNEKDDPAIVCFHNHGDDFHYWKFDWSPVKKFGGETRKGFIY